MRVRSNQSYNRPGFTFVELLVAMAVFALVAAMLAFPLLSALGYIEKASARQQAQVSANQAMKQMANELSTAMYVFDVPPDGSWVAFLCENSSASAQNLGLPMNVGSSAINYVRYARILDFPWAPIATGASLNWRLINPDYLANSATDINVYSHYWLPYYNNTGTASCNPYILTRFAPTDARATWANIWQQPAGASALDPNPFLSTLPAGLDGTYPMSGYSATNRTLLWRQFQDDLGAITPVGQEWDIPVFQATPLRLVSESLVLQANAGGYALPSVAVGRYPMWCGRNLDLDNLSDSQLGILYPGRALSDLDALLQSWTPLYPTRRVNPAWQPGVSPGMLNPYGYQVHIYDDHGNSVYGANYTSTGINAGSYSMTTSRHFMDWPALDRPDWNWSAPSSYLWTQNDINRQRLEGRLVFAQPLVPSAAAAANLQLQLPGSYQTTFSGVPAIFTAQNQQLQLPSTYTAGTPVVLPLPAGHWQNSLTRLVAPPQRMTFTDQYGDIGIFHLVNKTPSQLAAGEFCASTTTNLNPNGAFPVYRELTFGALLTATGNNPVWGLSTQYAPQAVYTISDLQPDDVVVASYSTKAVIDLALMLSRQDRAGQLAFSRQDFTVNRRVTADNALKHARDNR